MMILINNKEYKINEKKSLSQIFIDLGLPFSMPCGGNKRCGGCVVKAFGGLSEPTEFEKEKLGSRLYEGLRLACDTIVIGDCTVSFEESIKGEAGDTKNTLTSVSENDSFAAAIDIGTTTVAAGLYKMPEGVKASSRLLKNAQAAFGADVISRLTYAQAKGADSLKKAIREQIEEILSSFQYNADKVYITGNSAMLSLFAGIDIKGLCSAPFTLHEKFGRWEDKFYLLPCVSPFIGADALCGVISSGILDYENAMLIDMGTNSEIIYKKGDEYICASAAAGPCFEGAGIKMGMMSLPGAVNHVFSAGGSIQYSTIDDKTAVGICGSGLIDLVSCLLISGIVEPDGYLYSPFTIPNTNVTLYQEDIRAVQTAKSAIFSAISAVCDDFTKVEKVFISGGFGSSINVGNSINIGLLPRAFEKKVEFIGNSALKGAELIMQDTTYLEKAFEISKKCKIIDLTSSEKFNNDFIKNIDF